MQAKASRVVWLAVMTARGVRCFSAVLVLAACSGAQSARPSRSAPGVVIPTTLGEGTPRPRPERGTPDATSATESAAPPAPPAPKGGPPDPEPLRTADQWEYELAFSQGKVSVASVSARHFKAPVVTARRFGRFAIELWIGNELVERVRFDFPGLALETPPASGARKPIYTPVDLARGANVRQRVLVPAAPRARRAVLVDRATGDTQPLPWPPSAGPSTG